MKSTRYEKEWNGQDNSFYFIFSTNNSCTPHFHKNIEIIYNYAGSKLITINSRPYILRPNQLGISTSMDIHQYTNDGTDSYHAILIIPYSFSLSFNNLLQDRKLFSNLIDDSDQRIMGHIERLKAEKEKNLPNMLIVEGLMKCILGEIADRSIFVSADKNVKNDFLQSVFDYLEKHYKEPLTLEKIAKHFGYNKYYFSKLFNSSSVSSLNDCIGTIRLSHTLQYLDLHKCSTYVAALENGFGSVKTFYKYYKKFVNEAHKMNQ